MKSLGLIGLFLVLLTTISWAQGHHKKAKLNPEAKAALKEFQKNEVYPVKKALHDEFMGQLSAEDVAFVAAKRQEQAQLKEEAKALRQQAKEARKAGEEVDRKALVAPIREKQKALLASMEPFMEQQQVALDKVSSALESHQTNWKAQRKAIVEQHTTAEEQAKMKEKIEQRKAKRQEKATENRVSEEDKAKAKLARFILWDGEMKQRGERKGKKGKRPAPRGE
jgi:cbb3-type cytochrome oxidase subunit 3